MTVLSFSPDPDIIIMISMVAMVVGMSSRVGRTLCYLRKLRKF